MNKFLSIIVMGLILAVGANVAQAKPKTDKGDKAAKKEVKNAASIRGTVLKVDGTKITVQTTGKDSAEVTINTDASTKFSINGAPGAITDIKAGQKVAATPNTGTATKVTVTGSDKADKPNKGKNKKNPA